MSRGNVVCDCGRPKSSAYEFCQFCSRSLPTDIVRRMVGGDCSSFSEARGYLRALRESAAREGAGNASQSNGAAAGEQSAAPVVVHIHPGVQFAPGDREAISRAVMEALKQKIEMQVVGMGE